MHPSTLVTRDPATGLRRNPIRHPNNAPPTPFGCRWCGSSQNTHGRRWVSSAGLHTWQRPTNAQILTRMQARRATRLNAAPSKYHATTAWAADHTGESGEPYCADCKTDGCRRWMRVQDKLDRIRWGAASPQYAQPGGWGGNEPF